MPRVALPLFPLQEVVLFPGMVLPLHIFEERYVKMVQQCLAGDKQFGVVLLRSGEEVGGPAEPHLVGTVAQIQECREVAGGRYVLLAVGGDRFRLLRHWSEDGLLLGEIEPFDDDPDSGTGTELTCQEVRSLAAEHLRLVGEAVGKAFEAPEFPTGPRELSFLMASSLQGEPQLRQELLEGTDTAARLARLAKLLREQVATLGHRLAIHEHAEHITGGNGRLDYRHLTQEILDRVKPPAGDR